jgi:hypothetical protein
MGLQITVQNPISVTASNSSNDLLQKALDSLLRQTHPIRNVIARLMPIHECFKIMRYILKDKIQAPGSCLDNIEELHHVWVVQLSQHRYLANHIAWYTSLWRQVGKWNLVLY